MCVLHVTGVYIITKQYYHSEQWNRS